MTTLNNTRKRKKQVGCRTNIRVDKAKKRIIKLKGRKIDE